jgi:nicotinic acid mononucleotide adenylyltransferase
MRFVRRQPWASAPRSVAVLAGAFNPPTIAHAELVRAARRHVDQVICVLPKALPHKEFHSATLDDRVAMLGALGAAVAISEAGLLMDIARECGDHFEAGTRLFFICGGDAAERIMNWDYGDGRTPAAVLRDFELLVAARGAPYVPPHEVRSRVHDLDLPPGYHAVSSTEVRDRIARGAAWEHLVPNEIVAHVQRIYTLR